MLAEAVGSRGCLCLQLKVKVLWVKVVNPNVSVLSSTAVTLSIRVERHTVDGTEMTFDPAKLLFIGCMEEPGLKLADPGGGSCDLHGLLTTSHHHMIHNGRDGSRVDGSLCLEGLDVIQGSGVKQLG